MNEEKLYANCDNIFSPLGGVIKIDNEPEILKSLYKNLRDYFEHIINHTESEIKLKIDIIDNNDYNAVVTTQNNIGFIGIYKGLINKLNFIYECIQKSGSIFNNKYSSISFGLDKEQNAALTQFLMQTSIDFILYHEINHISKGHVGWSKSIQKNENGFYYECKTVESMNPLIHQALEIDADTMAAAFIILRGERHHQYCKKNPNAFNNVHIRKIYSSLEKTMICHIFSIFIVFLLFEEVNFNDEEYSTWNHPPLHIRQLSFIQLFSGFFVTKNKEESMNLNFSEILTEVSNEAQRFYDDVIGKVYEWEDAPEFIESYASKLENKLNSISEELNKFSSNMRTTIY